MTFAPRFSALAIAALLSACGSGAAPDPAEQIVVREPGQTPAPAPAPAATPAVTPVAATSPADLAAAGEQVFAVCATCHAVEPGAAAGPGPNLHGVLGRKAGSGPGFAYSAALKASGLSWDTASLDAYLADPVKTVPGTTMVAGALTDTDERKAVIAYLATLK
jgi:cytochrome c